MSPLRKFTKNSKRISGDFSVMVKFGKIPQNKLLVKSHRRALEISIGSTTRVGRTCSLSLLILKLS